MVQNSASMWPAPLKSPSSRGLSATAELLVPISYAQWILL